MAKSTKAKPITRDSIFVELCATLGTGDLHEHYIASANPHERIAGLCVGRKVIVNPVYHTVDTLLHECIHRIRPHWSERSVKRKTTQVMWQLSDAEIQRVYEVWLGARKCGRPITVTEDDTIE